MPLAREGLYACHLRLPSALGGRTTYNSPATTPSRRQAPLGSIRVPPSRPWTFSRSSSPAPLSRWEAAIVLNLWGWRQVDGRRRYTTVYAEPYRQDTLALWCATLGLLLLCTAPSRRTPQITVTYAQDTLAAAASAHSAHVVAGIARMPAWAGALQCDPARQVVVTPRGGTLTIGSDPDLAPGRSATAPGGRAALHPGGGNPRCGTLPHGGVDRPGRPAGPDRRAWAGAARGPVRGSSAPPDWCPSNGGSASLSSAFTELHAPRLQPLHTGGV
jgi:hypothetical protein